MSDTMATTSTARPAATGKTGNAPTGGLLFKGGQFYARFRTTIDGERVRVVRALGTDNRTVAKAKLRRLLEAELPVEQAKRGETFEEAARRLLNAQKEAGMRTWKDRKSRFEAHVFPVIGPMPMAELRARHLNDLLEGVTVQPVGGQKKRPSRQTLKHILTDVAVVLDDLWRKEQLPENVARRVRVPKAPERAKERGE